MGACAWCRLVHGYQDASAVVGHGGELGNEEKCARQPVYSPVREAGGEELGQVAHLALTSRCRGHSLYHLVGMSKGVANSGKQTDQARSRDGGGAIGGD